MKLKLGGKVIMLIKKITSAILAVAMVAAMSTTVFAEGPAPRYIDGDREVEYFDFNFDPSHSSEPGWDFSSAGAEKNSTTATL